MTPRDPADVYSREAYLAAEAATWAEAILQQRVEELATVLGWRWFHAPDNKPDARGRRQNVKRGFLDLVLVRGERVLWRELKRQREYPKPDQRAWIADLQAAGQDVAVWRPLDYLDGSIEADLRRRR